MMLSEAQLLNTKTLEQLFHLQAKIPNFLKNQLTMLRERWPLYIADVQSAVESGAYSDAADHCHKMKGHAGMLGFHAVQLNAGALETIFRNRQPAPLDQAQHTELVLQLDQVFKESLKSLDVWLSQNAE